MVSENVTVDISQNQSVPRSNNSMYLLASELALFSNCPGSDSGQEENMKSKNLSRQPALRSLAALLIVSLAVVPTATFARSGGGGGGGSTETIKVSKCYTNATANSFGQLLIKAASSNASAHLYAYRPDGTFQGEVQNGGGSRYGGTVMGYLPYDPGYMVIVSSSGATINAPTTPFIQ